MIIKRAAVGLLCVGLGVGVVWGGDGRIEISQADMTNAPYTISSSGSYVLTENLFVPAPNVSAILIGADQVTLDLNGFAVTGPGKSVGSAYGINRGSASYSGLLTVVNGRLTGWSAGGIRDASEATAIERIQVDGCGVGIEAAKTALVRNSVVRGCGTGIRVGMGSIVEGCSVAGCQANGIEGVGMLVSDCYLRDNSACGILAQGCSLVKDNYCYANTTVGIRATGVCNRVEANMVADGSVGLDLDGAGSFAGRNTASGNLTDFAFAGRWNAWGPVVGNRSDHPWANFRTTMDWDRSEPNDTLETAANLGALGSVSLTDLTIHDPADEDYYRFTTSESGTLVVSALFRNAAGDLDISLYDSEGGWLATSASVKDSEQVQYAVPFGTNLGVAVFGYVGDTNAYDLVIKVQTP